MLADFVISNLMWYKMVLSMRILSAFHIPKKILAKQNALQEC